jgi:hypothetical protein
MSSRWLIFLNAKDVAGFVPASQPFFEFHIGKNHCWLKP